MIMTTIMVMVTSILNPSWRNGWPAANLRSMSASEIIQQIKKLTPEERREVEAYLREDWALKDAPVTRTAQEDAPTGQVSAEFKAVVGKVFAENEELFRKLAQ